MPTIYKNNKCEFCDKIYTGVGKRFCRKKCADKYSIKKHWEEHNG